MKRCYFVIAGLSLFLINSCYLYGQNPVKLENAFDFWVGTWKVSWFTPDSSWVEGTNTIEKILDGKVLQEHFMDPNSNFKGTSISVYNPNDSTWHQAWADNAGGYFDFYGQIEGDKRIFSTTPKFTNNKDGATAVVSRMVFYDIQRDSLKWDWESSTNGGNTWQLQWRIFYERIQSINE